MKKPDPVRPNSWLIYPLPTQAQIAALASTTRETVARVLSQLNHEQIAERRSKTLYIRNMAQLQALAVKSPSEKGAPN
jgi:DNA-binding transcriptional regulator YhcF (GntR family)